MIDFLNVEKYRENNRIEAKKALGGLPHSIWETYSAFANTIGGVILLGVEEHSDKSLHPVNLPDPEMLIEDFWETLKNGKKVSANTLSENDVRIEKAEGKSIVVISVPKANRKQRPVYIDGNPFSGTYYRNGEGDCKCSREEVLAMMRDAEDVGRPLTETDIYRRMIFSHLTRCRTANFTEIALLLGNDIKAAEELLNSMTDLGITEKNPDGTYKLKD